MRVNLDQQHVVKASAGALALAAAAIAAACYGCRRLASA